MAASNGAALTPRMLPKHEYPIPRRERLIGIARDHRATKVQPHDQAAKSCRSGSPIFKKEVENDVDDGNCANQLQ